MRSPNDGRALALLNYSLLFFAFFFAGVPAVIAVALDYSQQVKVTQSLRNHYGFPIGLFWGSFLIALPAGILGSSGFFLALGEVLVAGGQSALSGFGFWKFNVHGSNMIMMISGAMLTAIDAVLLMVGSAIGFVRLASDRALGKSAL